MRAAAGAACAGSSRRNNQWRGPGAAGFAGRVRIEGFDPGAEPAKVGACYRLYVEGLPIDDPNGPPMSEVVFTGWVSRGFAGEPREAALALDGTGGSPAGAYVLELPHRRNTHSGYLVIMVAPGERRRGYGTALLRHAARRAAAHSRTLFAGDTLIGAPGSAFAAAAGARAGVVAVRRVLDLASIEPGFLARLRDKAVAAAPGYSLVSWAGATPGELLPGVATVSAAMADAPHNPGYKPGGPDVQRVRDGEASSLEMGIRRYSVAARCDRTGEMAGLTQTGIDPADPGWAYQFVTAVAREHRGHRLGLLVKIAMLEMLAEAEPGVRRVLTDNADANQHMIAINDELGFRVLDRWQTWELDVAAVTG